MRCKCRQGIGEKNRTRRTDLGVDVVGVLPGLGQQAVVPEDGAVVEAVRGREEREGMK